MDFIQSSIKFWQHRTIYFHIHFGYYNRSCSVRNSDKKAFASFLFRSFTRLIKRNATAARCRCNTPPFTTPAAEYFTSIYSYVFVSKWLRFINYTAHSLLFYFSHFSSTSVTLLHKRHGKQQVFWQLCDQQSVRSSWLQSSSSSIWILKHDISLLVVVVHDTLLLLSYLPGVCYWNTDEIPGMLLSYVSGATQYLNYWFLLLSVSFIEIDTFFVHSV